MVFAKAFLRRTNGANNFGTQIFFTADPVMDFFCQRIIKKSVHREITAQSIGPGAGETDFFRPPAILIVRLGAEGGHLKLLSPLHHNDDTKLPADRYRFRKNCFDLLRPGVRGNVKILRLAAEQEIAHAAAHPECGITRVLQPGNNCPGKGAG